MNAWVFEVVLNVLPDFYIWGFWVENLPSHCNSGKIRPISSELSWIPIHSEFFLSFLLLLDRLCATIATVSDFWWEFLRLPIEGKSSGGFCYLHTQREAAAPCFHSWCTATHEERLLLTFTGFRALCGQFFPPIFSPCSQAESIHHPKSVSRPNTCCRCCECLKSVQTDSEGGKQIDQIVIRREDAAWLSDVWSLVDEQKVCGRKTTEVMHIVYTLHTVSKSVFYLFRSKVFGALQTRPSDEILLWKIPELKDGDKRGKRWRRAKGGWGKKRGIFFSFLLVSTSGGRVMEISSGCSSCQTSLLLTPMKASRSLFLFVHRHTCVSASCTQEPKWVCVCVRAWRCFFVCNQIKLWASEMFLRCNSGSMPLPCDQRTRRLFHYLWRSNTSECLSASPSLPPSPTPPITIPPHFPPPSLPLFTLPRRKSVDYQKSLLAALGRKSGGGGGGVGGVSEFRKEESWEPRCRVTENLAGCEQRRCFNRWEG